MNQNGGIHKGGFAVLCHRNGGSESPGILTITTIQMEIVYNVGSHDVYSSHLQIKTAQTTILDGLRCFGIQNDS